MAVALCALLPGQAAQVREGVNYGYVYSGTKSQSVDFVIASMEADDMVLFGSSELSTPPDLVPEVPSIVFGHNPYGVELACIGEAYDQSLWHALAAGAYAPRLQNKKVAIIVSPSWFFDGGIDDSVFETRFSYSLYRAFMSNPSVSGTCKDYVQGRLRDQGVDDAVVRAGAAGDVLAWINDAAYAFADDLRIRNSLREVAGEGIERDNRPATQPNFAQWRAHAVEDAQKRSTNEWGFDDDFYENNVGEYKDQIQGRLAGETFTETPEYDDFGLFLRVCQESGLEPLVIVAPISGDYYDWTGIDAATRRTCYDHILQICEAYGVHVADFTDKEYEKYFLHDQVHFGWTGWVDVEEAIYRFAKED